MLGLEHVSTRLGSKCCVHVCVQLICSYKHIREEPRLNVIQASVTLYIQDHSSICAPMHMYMFRCYPPVQPCVMSPRCARLLCAWSRRCATHARLYSLLLLDLVSHAHIISRLPLPSGGIPLVRTATQVTSRMKELS